MKEFFKEFILGWMRKRGKLSSRESRKEEKRGTLGKNFSTNSFGDIMRKRRFAEMRAVRKSAFSMRRIASRRVSLERYSKAFTRATRHIQKEPIYIFVIIKIENFYS